MPSRNPKTTTDIRPSPKARAKALRAAAPAKPKAQTGLATDLHMMAGAIISDDGSAHFCDATGRVLRKPVADWIGFMAQRLSFQARQEMARQLNDPTLTDEARDSLALDLRRTLRIDALHILTGRADAAFEAARAAEDDLPDVPVRRNAFAGVVSPDLIRAIEAHREAQQLMLHDPDESDERTAAGVARGTMLGDAIRNFEARTLADLRHKVIYLWSGIMSEVGDTEARDNLISIEGDVLRLAGQAPEQDPLNPDAELLALEAEFVAADIARCASSDRIDTATDAYVAPPMPRALRVSNPDYFMPGFPQTGTYVDPTGQHRLRPFGEREVEHLRANPCMARYFGGTEGELQPDKSRLRPDPHAQARSDVIVAAWDAWQAEIAAAREAANLPELEAAHREAVSRFEAVLFSIRNAPAQSLVGLGVKARTIADRTYHLTSDKLRTAAEHIDPDDADGLLLALTADVLDLTGGSARG